MNNDPILKALELLEQTFGYSEPPGFLDKIAEYEKLVSTWNDYASLISHKDLLETFSYHVADSLSLMPYICTHAQRGSIYLDIGTGGGFPAFPVKLFAPDLECTLIERNTRKAAFIRKSISSLKLTNIRVLEDSFSASLALPQPFVLTARAIEKPALFLIDLASIMNPPSVFLRQTGPTPPALPPTLEETLIEDVFDDAALRRGRLSTVTSDT